MRKFFSYPRTFYQHFWKFFIRRLAQAHGFLDPIHLMARLNRFAQPSEILAPTELLRATAVLHARGLLNSQAIQHNLDWVWPYWVVCQFNPRSRSFVPRAFSLTHINLTHRNWTAVGSPRHPDLPIVDPRGLLTPFWDSWSVDAWLMTEELEGIFPSHLEYVSQALCLDGNGAVVTEFSHLGMTLQAKAEVREEGRFLNCCLQLHSFSQSGGWLAVSLRPYNPEGVSFIHDIEQLNDRPGWKVNGKEEVHFSEKPERISLANYRVGDVSTFLKSDSQKDIHCEIGMASAAALFKIGQDAQRNVTVSIPLKEISTTALSPAANTIWEKLLAGSCRLNFPFQPQLQFLYEAAIRTLILHTSEDVYAGPYTYKRFWFRDAAFILNALLCAGFLERVELMLQKFPARQKVIGYFESQEGEWDSNGEVLWILARYIQMTGKKNDSWYKMIHSAARWIERKRLSPGGDTLHAGLMPAGFSAEHLGPNDYYYWDNFWSVEGLQSAAYLAEQYHNPKDAAQFLEQAGSLSNSIDQSLKKAAEILNTQAMPSSPYRRLDSASIGSLAAGYPLQLWDAQDPRLLATAEYLLGNCLVEGAFFHDMSHSGINPYLTVHLAQVLLRAGDRRYFELLNSLAQLASPTGQWPEAIHPRTKGGCMGDGQHVWAAAEWTLLLRHCFLREEAGSLILCQGIHDAWLREEGPIGFGPAPTDFGIVSVSLLIQRDKIKVEWKAHWKNKPPAIEIRFPSQPALRVQPGQTSSIFPRAAFT